MSWVGRTLGSILPTALIGSLLGCNQDVQEPTGLTERTPELPQQSVSATAALSFLQVSAGELHSCGIASDNRAYCWGYNASGQLGTGTNTGPEQCQGAVGPFPCSQRPALVAGGHRFRQISAGQFHTCGITTDNRAFCWGSNDGQLGDGTTAARYSPVAVAGGRAFRQIEAGYSHSCAVTTDNRAFCWGNNQFGQLGDGTTTNHLSPVAVAGGHAFRLVSTGTNLSAFTCGVTTASRAFCWGRNNYGQLGDSTSAARRLRPVAVSGGRQFLQLDAGRDHACGVTTAKKAFCWGNGRNGQLGNGHTYLSFWPRAVAGGLSFDRVTAGGVHTCAESTTNRAYCWGNNTYGQLGDGTTGAPRATPAAVAGGLLFSQLSAGGYHTCGKSSDSTVYCWGYGFFGQLGNGTQDEQSTPFTVDPPAGTT